MKKFKPRAKKKIFVIALFVILTILTSREMTGLACAAEEEEQTDSADKELQTILSWTDDPRYSQTITWKGKKEKSGYVTYWETENPRETKREIKASLTEVKKGKYYRYQADLMGLKPDTEYTYAVRNAETAGGQKTFQTAPDQTDEFSFLYLGDIQYEDRNRDYGKWGELIRGAYEKNPGIAFGLTGGDMVDKNANIKDWDHFLAEASAVFSQVDFMTVCGNHETSVKPLTYLNMVAVPENGPEDLEEEFYSFDYGNCHFVGLNSCFFLEERREHLSDEEWTEQVKKVNKWLSEDLLDSDKTWKIVFMHHPAYGIEDDHEVYEVIRDNWEGIFIDTGVKLVFCGHQHVYMRTEEINGITYIMGNSGQKRTKYHLEEDCESYVESLNTEKSTYQIIHIDDNKLSLVSYDQNGEILDGWTKRAEDSPLKKIVGFIIIIGVLLIGIMIAIIFLRRSKTS